MAFVFNAPRDIADGIAIVKQHCQYLSLLQGFQLELGLHEVVRANHSAKIKF